VAGQTGFAPDGVAIVCDGQGEQYKGSSGGSCSAAGAGMVGLASDGTTELDCNFSTWQPACGLAGGACCTGGICDPGLVCSAGICMLQGMDAGLAGPRQ
jgi:hypothetical protein